MLIDTHAHLNFKQFNKDRSEVIKTSLDNNVWLINASSNFNTSELSVGIAEKYNKGVYSAIGLHPIDAIKEDFNEKKYKELAKSKKVVAIGEIGLDYLYPEKQKQKKTFLQQMELARELNLPIIIHCRKAHNDMIETLRKSNAIKGVVHCFTGNWTQAKQYLEMGFYLGFNGIIYKINLDKIIKKVPLNRILIETDCPYLTPPMAESKRNEPIFVKYVAQYIANVCEQDFRTIADATTKNAKDLFKI